ncbi:MAG: hypothetical protein ACRC52_19110, partial [Aeromonas veronii]
MTISDRMRSAMALPGLLVATLLSTAALAQSAPGQVDGEPVREAQPSQSVRDVLREEHTLFSDRLTIEPGIT